MKEVPAKICTICGEYYLSTEISTKVLQKAEEAFNKGVEIEVIKLNSVA